jgi:cyanophycinase
MKPKGKLLIIGGAEDKGEETLDMENKNIKFKRYELLKELLLKAQNKPVEIITSGSSVPNEVRRSYERAFDKITHQKPGFISIQYRSETKDKDYLERIKNAGSVFFSGGDQSRLLKILSDTPILDLIKQRYMQDANFLLAGTSAGAMAMSDIMITGGGLVEALISRSLKWSAGLNIFSNCIIDTHFFKRCRFGRLAHAISIYPDHLGIGLGEDTALIIKNGTEAECRGSGMVAIIDGKNIKKTNIHNVEKGEPIFIENLRVHLLVKGTRFSIKDRHFL